MTAGAVDVAVAGGGPAGAAAALSLSRHDPSLSVTLIESTPYVEPRIGETLPPLARSLLEHLGVWEAFSARRELLHRPVHGTVAAWGDATTRENDYLFGTAGAGWHLDRRAFDDFLAGEAEARGTEVRRGCRVLGVEREGDGFRLRLSGGASFDARAVVDATGRRATVARALGARVVRQDRLLALVRFYEEGSGGDPRSLVETFADGWWYTAGLPGGRRVVMLMTDADLVRGLRLHEPEAWSRRLAAAPEVSTRLDGARPLGGLVGRPADSRRLEPAAGGDAAGAWIAVGDAASVFDPLSSQGIVKALRSGVLASYALADLLTKGDTAGFERYRAFVESEFASYLETRARFYREEVRFADREFWRRRH
jgi:flavin-dependent dehydrogenase